MKAGIIAPGSVLGVLGGGQLGAMFTVAAYRLGYHVAVWDPDPEAPAHRLATHSFPFPFTDQHVLARFADLVSVVTYEWENIPAELCRALEQRKPVCPSSAILSVIQDRIAQKNFLASHGFSIPPFVGLASPDQLLSTVRQVGYPALCKTATAGYDGKGQWRISRESEVREVEHAILESARPGMRWIVESLVPFERELSILAVRGADGQSCTYPIVENEHEDTSAERVSLRSSPDGIESWRARKPPGPDASITKSASRSNAAPFRCPVRRTPLGANAAPVSSVRSR